MTMSDITDDKLKRIARARHECPWMSRQEEIADLEAMAAELQSHRAAVSANEERVRNVVSEIGRAMIAAQVNAGAWLDSLYLQGPAFVDAIASRAAKQLATAAVGLSEEERVGIQAVRDVVAEVWNIEPIPGTADTSEWAAIRRGVALLDRLLATGAKP
jgi:hypothetical protein